MNLPETSSYPIVDFAVKGHFADPSKGAEDIEIARGVSTDLSMTIGDRLIRKRLEGTGTMLHK